MEQVITSVTFTEWAMTMISHLTISKPCFMVHPLAALRNYLAGHALLFEHAFETVLMAVLAAFLP